MDLVTYLVVSLGVAAVSVANAIAYRQRARGKAELMRARAEVKRAEAKSRKALGSKGGRHG